jgi:enoyl-CoA hydratase
MAYKTIILSEEEGIATITLNRPEVHNAMNQQLNDELRKAVQEVKKSKEARVLIITGAGDKAFSAGMDLKEYSEKKDTTVEDWVGRSEQGGSFGLAGMPKPVIAAINGYAIAGGLELALACDIRIASEKATFGLYEIRRGFFPGGGATWRLAPLVGKGWAMEMILSGESITAEVAERIGLVNRVVPHEELMTNTRELAQKIASKSLAAVILAKGAINQSLALFEQVGSNISIALRSLAETNEDAREGTRAFLDKREAEFKE